MHDPASKEISSDVCRLYYRDEFAGNAVFVVFAFGVG